MAYEELKAQIREYIKPNEQEEITGAIMQAILLEMVNQLGAEGSYLPLTGGNVTGGIVVSSDLSSPSHEALRLNQSGISVEKIASVGLNEILNVTANSITYSSYFPSETPNTLTISLGYTGITLSGGVTAASFINSSVEASIRYQYLLKADGNVISISDIGGTDMQTVWEALAASTNEQINVSHLSTALNGYIHPTLSNLSNGDILIYDSVGTWVNTSMSSFLSGYATETWVTTQLASYATQSWVSTNYLNRVSTNSGDIYINDGGSAWVIANLNTLIVGYGYITASALNGYATEAWVGQQGYLTSSALNGYIHPTITNLANGDILIYDSVGTWVNVPISSFLSGYATQSWVNQQGFSKFNPTINSPQNRDIVVYESGGAGWLNASLDTFLSGYATESWVTSQGYYSSGSSPYFENIYLAHYLYMPNSNGTYISTIDRDGNKPIFGYGQGVYGYTVYYTGRQVNICGGSSWNSTAGIYITAANNVGIGTTSPAYKLDVNGSANATTLYENGTALSSKYIGKVSANSGDIWINDGGSAWVTTNLNSTISGFGYIKSSGSCNYATSAGNADTLDSFHANSFKGYYHHAIDAQNLDNDTWYPVVINIGRGVRVRIQIEGYSESSPSPSWNGRRDGRMVVVLDYTAVGSNWGWVSPSSRVDYIAFGSGSDDSNCLAGIHQLYREGYSVVYVRGGAYYNLYTSKDVFVQLCTSATTFSSGDGVAPTTTPPTPISRDDIRAGDKISLFNNDSGYITSAGSCAYASSAGNISISANSGDILINDGGSSWVTTNLNSAISGFGYITSSGSCAYANSAGSVAWSNVSGRPTNVSSFTNDSGYITSSGSCNYATSSGTTNGINISANSGDILICDGGRSWVTVPSSYISDIRKKDVLNYNAEPTFEAVANAPAIRFTYKDARYSFNQGVKVGSIAQYWQTTLPETVSMDNEGMLSMQYDVIALLSTISVAKKVSEHERRIILLERENEQLKKEIQALKSA